MRDIEKTTVGDFRKMQAEYLNRVCFGNDAIKILKNGRTMGVVISEQEFERYLKALAAYEDAADIGDSEQALEEVRSEGARQGS